MKTYYYVHTGHRVGLDRFRRACTIIRALGDVDITLLCSDFRIANEAKNFGVEKAVGIDVVRNIPKIANHGDKLIFDSDEANPIMLDDMRNFFSTFIRVSDDKNDSKAEGEFLISPYLSGEGICNAVAVDDKYFVKEEKTIKLAYFFGDDDYEKDLEKNLGFVEELNPDLLLGFYYFLDYEDFLRNKFENHHEFEEYDEVIKKSQILITASPQTVFENLASGGKPIYLQRDGCREDFLELFESLKVPVIKNYEKECLVGIISLINNRNYSEMEHSVKKIANFIKENLTL
ncbi:hypothetical protein [Sulfurimonas sp.]|uniref:hypothetical protein n=1 Tax=Sulfurimonas sp. TaxID=2022749 RepID=UPI0025DF80E3|nr:hypothetical protein [Sulfurimonas sp.]MBW6488501.1 hypothetical protein [Sulfurimonas sp.]